MGWMYPTAWAWTQAEVNAFWLIASNVDKKKTITQNSGCLCWRPFWRVSVNCSPPRSQSNANPIRTTDTVVYELVAQFSLLSSLESSKSLLYGSDWRNLANIEWVGGTKVAIKHWLWKWRVSLGKCLPDPPLDSPHDGNNCDPTNPLFTRSSNQVCLKCCLLPTMCEMFPSISISLSLPASFSCSSFKTIDEFFLRSSKKDMTLKKLLFR